MKVRWCTVRGIADDGTEVGLDTFGISSCLGRECLPRCTALYDLDLVS